MRQKQVDRNVKPAHRLVLNRQRRSEKQAGEQQKIAGDGKPLTSALKFGIALQLCLLVLTALVLDGGQLFRLCSVAATGYWLGVAMIVVRRKTTPTRLDLYFIRYGNLVLLVLVPLIADVVYGIIGESPFRGLERLF